MYVFEEYAERIGLEQIFIKYAEKSFIFFEGYPREILEIEKIVLPNSPNKFRATKHSIASRSVNEKYFDIEWDCYEDFIIKNYKGIKNAISDIKIVFIYSWETFLFYKQEYFINYFSHNSIYKTVDFSLSEDERINNINGLIDVLKLENNIVYNAWKNFRYGPDCYSYWLANIINE